MVGSAVATIVPSIELITWPSCSPTNTTSVRRNVSCSLTSDTPEPFPTRVARTRSTVWPVALLEVEQVSVPFGGVQALDVVDLDVDRRAVTGLIGPNGAGKTTLFNVICGLQSIDRGTIALGGDGPRRGSSRTAGPGSGIARTFQRLEVFGSMIDARQHPRGGRGAPPWCGARPA